MTDIIEKAAVAAEIAIDEACENPDSPTTLGRRIVRAVIRSLRDNTDSPRVCDELTRMLGEEGK